MVRVFCTLFLVSALVASSAAAPIPSEGTFTQVCLTSNSDQHSSVAESAIPKKHKKKMSKQMKKRKRR